MTQDTQSGVPAWSGKANKRSSLQRHAIRAREPSPSHVFAACGATRSRSCLQRHANRAREPSPSHVFASRRAKKPRSTGARCVAETSVASQLHILPLSEGAERAERANEKDLRGVKVCHLSGVGAPAKWQTFTSRNLLERKAGTERKPASVSWHEGRRVACRPERSACLERQTRRW